MKIHLLFFVLLFFVSYSNAVLEEGIISSVTKKEGGFNGNHSGYTQGYGISVDKINTADQVTFKATLWGFGGYKSFKYGVTERRVVAVKEFNAKDSEELYKLFEREYEKLNEVKK